MSRSISCFCFFFFQAEDGIRDLTVTGVQTCALPISSRYRKEICFERWYGSLSNEFRRRPERGDRLDARRRRRRKWGRQRGGAWMGSSHDLHFQPGWLRRGLPVLSDCAAGDETQPDGRGNCWAGLRRAE